MLTMQHVPLKKGCGNCRFGCGPSRGTVDWRWHHCHPACLCTGSTLKPAAFHLWWAFGGRRTHDLGVINGDEQKWAPRRACDRGGNVDTWPQGALYVTCKTNVMFFCFVNLLLTCFSCKILIMFWEIIPQGSNIAKSFRSIRPFIFSF